MKNKKSLLSLGLFALVLVLGVGYAVVSNVGLEFGGTATVKNADIKVDIASVEANTTGEAKIEHTFTTHSKKASFTITDMVLNEEVTVTYKIDNHESDVAAKLTEKTALSYDNKNNYEVSYTIGNNGELAANGSLDVVVTVKMIKTPVVESNATTTISFELDAAAVNNATN